MITRTAVFSSFGISLMCLLLPGAAFSQQIAPAPLPTLRYASLANQAGPTEEAAQAEVGKEGEEGDLSFLDKDLSEISRTQVTSPALSSDIESVSRTTQPLARTPAAVYVVTNEMIRRCGARNIPEVLRTVPGVNVARINASAWAISIRGFNSRFANKLLVQIDGVAIYNPTHGGVFWQNEYVMLEDVDRIEVIRGPGAAVWGVNAVNGVINIVTKSSKDTKGIYADGGGGNEHRQFGDFRVGGQSGNLTWRMYGFNAEDGKGYVASPRVADDDPLVNQGGFRADWTPTGYDTVTIQGDFYQGVDNQWGSYLPPSTPYGTTDCSNTTFLTRWVRKIDEDTDWALQCYYFNPNVEGYSTNMVSTFDLDFQYHMKRGRHDVVWGFGYRNSNEKWILGNYVYSAYDNEQIPSYFIQDTITLADERLFATFGSKFDHNSVTHFEYQPTARVAWTPSERTSIWGAVSRAARTPALAERMTYKPESEYMMAYEAGIRRQPTDRLFWELSTFFNRYHNLLARTTGYHNLGRADTYGFELNATYELNPRWHLTGWYAFLVEDADYVAGSTPLVQLGTSPRNAFYLQSGWDLGRDWTLDVMFRYVDSLEVGVESYFTSDIRLAWRPTKHFEVSLVGQDLLCGDHPEFVVDRLSYPTEVQPGVYGMVSWRY